MNDIRRTILWVIFGFSMVLLWDQWQIYNGKSATFFPSSKPAATATAPAGASSVPASSVPAATGARRHRRRGSARQRPPGPGHGPGRPARRSPSPPTCCA